MDSIQSMTVSDDDRVPQAEMHNMPGHLIRRMHQASQAIFDGEMSRTGFDLTPVQYAALAAIAERPGLDQASLASAIVFDRATTGGVIDRLEGKGYVRREIDRADRRARRLFLEQAGDDARGLSDRECATLLALLGKALAAVGDVSRQSARERA